MHGPYLARRTATCARFLAAGLFLRSVSVVVGERGEAHRTLTVLTSLFSWELDGPMASLLGKGVMLAGRAFELDLVVSFKYRAGSSFLAEAEALAEGEEAGPLVVVAEALVKKPKMLCCLPVETVVDFLLADAVLAGVRAAVDFSPMLLLEANIKQFEEDG